MLFVPVVMSCCEGESWSLSHDVAAGEGKLLRRSLLRTGHSTCCHSQGQSMRTAGMVKEKKAMGQGSMLLGHPMRPTPVGCGWSSPPVTRPRWLPSSTGRLIYKSC